MKNWRVLAMGTAMAVSAICSGALAASDPETALGEGRRAAAALNDTLRGKLVESMRSEGPAGAMRVCSWQAQAIGAEVAAKQGVPVRRTSLKLRNPKNAPDAYERELLVRLQAQSREGRLPDEVFETQKAGGKTVYRYAKPLQVGPLCISCHGETSKIPKEIRELLKEKYPSDEATGYKPGDFRGIVSVVIPAE